MPPGGRPPTPKIITRKRMMRSKARGPRPAPQAHWRARGRQKRSPVPDNWRARRFLARRGPVHARGDNRGAAGHVNNTKGGRLSATPR